MAKTTPKKTTARKAPVKAASPKQDEQAAESNTEQASADNAPPADKTGFKVTVKRNGFRRAGRAWVGTTEIGPDELTDAQLDAVRNDPTFTVDPL